MPSDLAAEFARNLITRKDIREALARIEPPRTAAQADIIADALLVEARRMWLRAEELRGQTVTRPKP